METTKGFDGKALYQPKGKAKEYAEWAVNYYTGCSNECDYCYLKKGIGKKTLGGNVPTLKKCFKSPEDAIRIYLKELEQNKNEIGNKGVFLSFTTDPMLPETRNLTFATIELSVPKEIPVQVLTKRTDWLSDIAPRDMTNGIYGTYRHRIAFGFTLTGCDENEPHASTNAERIKAMKRLWIMGFPTFASIEPVIDPRKARNVIAEIKSHCDLIKVGLMSGKRDYDKAELQELIQDLKELSGDTKVYLKDSIVNYLGIKRKDLPERFVNANYNLFTGK